MDKEYVYEDEQEEGLTFKKIWHFLQKGWLRMVVYAVIAVLLATAIALPVKSFVKSEPVAQTSIEYIYKGVEEGLAPNGALLDTDNIISTTVLAKAVDEANLGGKINDISTLRNVIRVEGVETDEYVRLSEAAANGDVNAVNTLRTYVMHPTRFNIIISNPSALGLSDDQAKMLLNKVVSCYYADFQQRYTVTKMFADSAYELSKNEQLEFADIHDIYVQSLESVKTFLQDMADDNDSAGFVSTQNNTSFTQLLSDLSILRNNYSLFNANILSKNVWRNKATARDSLLSTQTDILNRLEPLNGNNGYIEALKSQIASIKPTTSSSDSSGVHTEKTEYPKIYETLHVRLEEAYRQVEEYNVQLKTIETRLEKLGDDTQIDKDTLDKVAASLGVLEEETARFIRKVNATVADYYDTTFVSSSVRQIQSPIVTRRSMGISLLVVYAVAVIVALLVAGVVTVIKMTKAKSNVVKQEAPATQSVEENN